MGAISTGALSISNWVNEKNALTGYEGLYLNRFWIDWIIANNNPKNTSSVVLDFFTAYSLFSTFSRAEYLLSPERVTAYAKGFFPDPRGPYFYTALLFVVLNVAKSFKSNPAPVKTKSVSDQEPVKNSPTRMDQILVVVSKATPYLMVITNIAVAIIQIRSGETSAWLTLVFTGITVIDVTSWKPKNYGWYCDTVLAYPVSAAAFYYVNNLSRLKILFKLALNTPIMKKKIADTMNEMKKAIPQMQAELTKLITNHKFNH